MLEFPISQSLGQKMSVNCFRKSCVALIRQEACSINSTKGGKETEKLSFYTKSYQ